jgi:hypothetical protein
MGTTSWLLEQEMRQNSGPFIIGTLEFMFQRCDIVVLD